MDKHIPPHEKSQGHAESQQKPTARASSKERTRKQAQHHNDARGHHTRSDSGFDQTIEQVRKQLPRTNRPFSRLIHIRSLEAASDFLGKTIARPHALLAGGITAFLGTLVLYNYAKFAGFSLQGSETLVTFAVGWVVGLVYDLAKAMFGRSEQ